MSGVVKEERPIVLECAGDRLVAVLHAGSPDAAVGIAIVVGGPQYRVGSHRLFVLMARRFAAEGIPVLRFDARGMGDSEGDPRSFEALDADVRAAIDVFMAQVPKLAGVVLLGLCDAASVNLMYGYTDSRVRGLILMNPWVRTFEGEAKARLRHYYLQRVLQTSFWQKAVSGKLSVGRSVRALVQSLKMARNRKASEQGSESELHFVKRMLSGWELFEKPVLIILSRRDLTAQEFGDLCREDSRWKKVIERSSSTVAEFPQATHTLSEEVNFRSVCERCLEWMDRI